MTKDELEALGREHGLELDKRKSVAKLREELAAAGVEVPAEAAEAAEPGAAEPGVDVEILRDVWDAGGVRQRRGSVVAVSTDTALEWLEKGLAKRAA